MGYQQQQQQTSTNYNTVIDSNYNQSIRKNQENEVECSHNITTENNKKEHVKFSKKLTSMTIRKSSLKKWQPSTKAASTHQQIPGASTVKVGTSVSAATLAPSTFYYYNYYNNANIHQLPAMNDEQQQVYNINVADSYNYFMNDGSFDANYNEFMNQSARTDSYNNWRR